MTQKMIKKLIAKEDITGDDLGRLEVIDLATIYKQRLSDMSDEHIYTGQEHADMIRRCLCATEEDEDGERVLQNFQEYNRYRSLIDWLMIYQGRAQMRFHYCYLQWRTMLTVVEEAQISESTYNYVQHLPAVMTQRQYDGARTMGREFFFQDDDGSERMIDGFRIITLALAYYVCELKQDARRRNPLKAVRRAYVNEPVTSQDILTRWNDVTDTGYYLLDDGRRSDRMTNREWMSTITSTPWLLETFNKLDDHEKERLCKAEKINLGFDSLRKAMAYNFAEIPDTDEDEPFKRGFKAHCKWITREEPPEDLTKWDVVEEDKIYRLFDSQDPESMRAFMDEFPELVEALLNEIAKSGFPGLEELPGLEPEEWASFKVSARELYDMDFPGARYMGERDDLAFFGNFRAFTNGVAILQPKYCNDSYADIDSSGRYIEPDISTVQQDIRRYSLECFFPECPEQDTNVYNMNVSRIELYDSWHWLLAYDHVITKTMELHNFPELSVYRNDMRQLKEDIDFLSSQMPKLRDQVNRVEYSNALLQIRKLEVLDRYFTPIDLNSEALTEDMIKTLDDAIADFSLFQGRREEIEDTIFFPAHG